MFLDPAVSSSGLNSQIDAKPFPNDTWIDESVIKRTWPFVFLWDGINNKTTMHYAEWIARKKWNVRTHAGGHGSAIDAAMIEKILAQPVKPQGQLPASQD